MAKTRVAPIKRLTVPRLELSGALVTAKLLHHCRKILDVPLSATFAWTDSTIVLSWLRGNPGRFKPFVGNRVAQIVELIPSNQWRHVSGISNPADHASRGLYPQELAGCELWWKGPEWLHLSQEEWPEIPQLSDRPIPVEEKEPSLNVQVALVARPDELPLLGRVSSFTRLKRITAWILRFARHARPKNRSQRSKHLVLDTKELHCAE